MGFDFGGYQSPIRLQEGCVVSLQELSLYSSHGGQIEPSLNAILLRLG